MKIKIHGKEQELKFNVGFIRRLDEMHQVKNSQTGMSFGFGLLTANVQLMQYSVPMLSDIILCGLVSNKVKVTQSQVDDFIEQYADDNDGLDGLFNEVEESLGKSQVCRTTMQRLKSMNKKAEQQIG